MRLLPLRAAGRGTALARRPWLKRQRAAPLIGGRGFDSLRELNREMRFPAIESGLFRESNRTRIGNRTGLNS